MNNRNMLFLKISVNISIDHRWVFEIMAKYLGRRIAMIFEGAINNSYSASR